MNTRMLKVVWPIASAMLALCVFVVAFAQSSVPQDIATAATLYQVPTSVLYPVIDVNTGATVGWKIESQTALTAVLPIGACSDVISSTTTLVGKGTVMYSLLEDWKRVQSTGVVTMTGNAATVYMGTCGPIVELVAKVIADPVLNARKGPGTSFAKLGTVANGAEFYIQARNSAGTWVYGITPTHMGAWFAVQFLSVTGDVMSLPIADVLSPAPTAPTTSG